MNDEVEEEVAAARAEVHALVAHLDALGDTELRATAEARERHASELKAVQRLRVTVRELSRMQREAGDGKRAISLELWAKKVAHVVLRGVSVFVAVAGWLMIHDSLSPAASIGAAVVGVGSCWWVADRADREVLRRG